jgi:hypothetical protein
MVDIDLLHDTGMMVFVCDKNPSISKIRELILLPSEYPNNITPKPPWEFLLIANSFQIESGIYANKNTYIKLFSNNLDISNVSKLTYYNFYIAILQHNSNNGLQCAILDSSLIGCKVKGKEDYMVTFDCNECNMIYEM